MSPRFSGVTNGIFRRKSNAKPDVRQVFPGAAIGSRLIAARFPKQQGDF
jgi:hypothetical protein